MKQADLVKRVRKMAKEVDLSFELKREGGNHTIYELGGKKIVVPRHREINELTAKGILKTAEEAVASHTKKIRRRNPRGHQMKITAIATQSEGWWAIEVPEVGFMTQAKRLTEIENMARSLVVDVLEIKPETVEVEVKVVLDDEIANTVKEAVSQMREAQKQLAAASKASFDAVNELRNRTGLSVREVAKLLQISAGRVTQISQKDAPATTPVEGEGNFHVLTAAESKRADFVLAN